MANSLKVVNLNVRSLLPKFVDFRQLVFEKYDVIGVSETWLKPTVDSNVISLPNYIFHRKDRLDRIGGV